MAFIHFEQALADLKNRRPMAAPFYQLKTKVGEQLSVNILYAEEKKVQTGNYTARLDFYVTAADYTSLHRNDEGYYGFDPEKQRRIAEAYYQILKETGRISLFGDKQAFISNLFVCPHNFTADYQTYVIRSCFADYQKVLFKKLKNKRLPVQQIFSFYGGIHVFYYTKEQRKHYENKAADEQIRMLFYRYVKRYDCLKQLKPENISIYYFDKESLDNEYEGNTYYYLK